MYKIDFNIQEKKLAIQIPLYTREEQRSKRWKVSMCNCYKLFISVSFMGDFFFSAMLYQRTEGHPSSSNSCRGRRKDRF